MARQIRVNVDDEIDQFLATRSNATEYINALIREDMDFRSEIRERLDDLEAYIAKLVRTKPAASRENMYGFGGTTAKKGSKPATAANRRTVGRKVANKQRPRNKKVGR